MARVYVGTYKKYNEGSLAGAWLNLGDYSSYGEFLTACRKVHKNESDPEFMIQDTEDFPDGLDCMEWLGEQDFNDVKAAMSENSRHNVKLVDYSDKSFVVKGDTRPIKEELKKLGGMWFKKETGWLFSNKKREQVEKFIAGGEVVKAERVEKTNKFTDWLKEFVDTKCITGSDKEYYGKGSVGAIKIDGHFYLIDKPRIENRFCFRDEGPQYEHYKELRDDNKMMERYFIRKNEEDFTRTIEGIEKGEEVRIKNTDYLDRLNVYVGGSYWDRQEGRKATDEEKTLILEGLKYGLSLFRKRLDTYLKRYGTSKLHTWTYWADA
jgi:hypothetical protein